jgi:putative ABC transport system substrate-binding protein
LKEIQAAAPALGVKPLPLEAKGPDDIDRAFATMRKERPGALLVIGDPMLGEHRRRIIEFGVKSRVPAIYTSRLNVDAGGLMSYATDFANLHRRAATYVDKILRGTKPGDLPVEQPTRFELVINLKTAKALGLTIPQSVLIRADQVIQ